MDCPQEEITGARPTNYSSWHREALPRKCYMTDGDWFEQRVEKGDLVSVAYIETVQVPLVDGADKEYPLWRSKKSLCQEIKDKMSIPVYIVWHNSACNDFLVLKLGEARAKRLCEPEYIEFIKGL
jgi:hypothetical protein